MKKLAKLLEAPADSDAAGALADALRRGVKATVVGSKIPGRLFIPMSDPGEGITVQVIGFGRHLGWGEK